MQTSAQIVGFLALLASGLMAGFFYAYSFSVMWGLDRANPHQAIAGMNGINVAVQNPIFLLCFMGTPLLLILTALLFWLGGHMPALGLFATAAAVYLIGTFGVTIAVNVPMNNALANAAIPTDINAARDAWTAYSTRWTPWNHIRTASATLALALAALGFFQSAN